MQTFCRFRADGGGVASRAMHSALDEASTRGDSPGLRFSYGLTLPEKEAR